MPSVAYRLNQSRGPVWLLLSRECVLGAASCAVEPTGQQCCATLGHRDVGVTGQVALRDAGLPAIHLSDREESAQKSGHGETPFTERHGPLQECAQFNMQHTLFEHRMQSVCHCWSRLLLVDWLEKYIYQ
jgi:hypothetical protein